MSTTQVADKANRLADIPMEQWHANGLPTKAVSANANGMVNSFIAVIRGQRFYGHRKHEFINGAFTGKSWFEVESANR